VFAEQINNYNIIVLLFVGLFFMYNSVLAQKSGEKEDIFVDNKAFYAGAEQIRKFMVLKPIIPHPSHTHIERQKN